MSMENLAYLSSEQALADLAEFKTAMVEVLDTYKSKWITFGGSYPGKILFNFTIDFCLIVWPYSNYVLSCFIQDHWPRG